MRIQLSPEEINALKMLHQTYKTDQKKSDRIKAILMLNNGYSAGEVASVLMINKNTVTGWKKRYLNERDGVNWLLNRYEGYTGKLNETELSLVIDYVDKHIISDSKQVQKFIQEAFGIKYSRTGIKSLLHRVGFK